jgi:DHA1 family multidrug resistance protein-like MFS transporter
MIHSSFGQFNDVLKQQFDSDSPIGGITANNSKESLPDNSDLEKGNQDADNVKDDKAKKEEQKQKDPNLIEWDGPHDVGNPMNWTTSKKWIITIALGMMTFCVTFASSVFSNATVPVAELYHVSTEVATLGTSLFVLGFGVGPLIWGPGSELFGRKTPLFFGYFCFAIFQVPVAVAQNLYTIMICRFFGGVFASAPLAIVGGALADFWNPVDRGIAVCVFAGATFIGPIAGMLRIFDFVDQS